MNGIASRLDRFEESASARASQIARDLAAAGGDILRLTTGEPDFPTPEHVKRAATEAMRREETKYTNISGTPALKHAVAAKFRRENGLAYTADQILVGAGAKQVIFNAMMATLEPGDEVLVALPYYVSYHDIVRLAEGTPVLVACAPGNGFRMRAEDLAAAITPRTRWLILNSPGNPTGAVYSAAELKAFAAVLARYPRVWVLADDIYEHILFDGAKFATFAQAAPEMYERTLTVNGVSKAYAMTGWRIGYGGGPQHLIKAMAKVQSQVTHAPSSIGQAAAVAALEGPQELVAERSHMFEQRRNFVAAALNQIPGLSAHLPQGAFYMFPSCAGAIGRRTPAGQVISSDKDFAHYLLEAEGVAVMDGAAYGLSPYLRISIASSIEVLGEACTRIARACAALK
jgi:aspartate aminotransferase